MEPPAKQKDKIERKGRIRLKTGIEQQTNHGIAWGLSGERGLGSTGIVV